MKLSILLLPKTTTTYAAQPEKALILLKQLRTSISGLLIFLAVALFAHSAAFAQDICYRFNQCHDTLEEAEAEMRAVYSDVGGDLLELIGARVENTRLRRVYGIRPVAAEGIMALGWSPGSGLAGEECTGNSIPGLENHCSTIEQVIQRLRNYQWVNTVTPCSVDVTASPLEGYNSTTIPPNETRQYLLNSLGISSDRLALTVHYVGSNSNIIRNYDACDVQLVTTAEMNCSEVNCIPLPNFGEFLSGVCPEGYRATGVGGAVSFEGDALPWPYVCINSLFPSIYEEDTSINGQCDDTAGNPCNIVTGAKSLDLTIANFSGISVKLNYLNQQLGQNNSLIAKGWRHNFDSHIQETVSSTEWKKTLIHSNGKVTAFNQAAGSSDYYPLNKGGGILKQVTAQLYHYLSGNKRYTYSAFRPDSSFHHLSSITDLNSGETLTINRDLNNRVISVNSNSGRTINFNYTANKLNSISIDDNVIASFAYTEFSASRRRLDSVVLADETSTSSRTFLYTDTRFPTYITAVIDENGDQYATYAYDGKGRATLSQHAGNAGRVNLVYGNGQTTVTTPTGSTKTYQFERPTNLAISRVNSINEDGLINTLTYSANNMWIPEDKTDPNDNLTLIDYDNLNRTISRTEGSGTPEAVTTTTSWNNAYNRPSQMTYPGQTVSYTYNTRGQVLTRTVTDSASGAIRRTTYTYHESASQPALLGRIATINGPRVDVSDITTYDYYTNDHANFEYRTGDLKTITNAIGQVIEFLEYDYAGRPLRIEDVNNVVTTLTYHPRGWLTSSTVSNEITVYHYDNVGNLTRITQPDGSFIEYSYDAAHRLTGVEDTLGNRIEYTLDNAGNRTIEQNFDDSNTLRYKLTRVYDQLGRLEDLLDSGGVNGSDYSYDNNGNNTSLLDPVNRGTGFEYDALDRLKKIIDADTNETLYNYDGRNNLITVTDPLGHITNYTYDGLDNLKELDSPDTGITLYGYDEAGNRIEQTDARGVVANYSYDALNRLTSITYPASSVLYNVTFTYDNCAFGKGRLCSTSDLRGSTSWSYDDAGRVSAKTQTTDGISLTINYQYDTAGLLEKITYPSGKTITYGYNPASQITSMDISDAGAIPPGDFKFGGGSTTDTPLITSASYLPFGPISSITYAQAGIQTRSYNLDYDPTGFSGNLNRSYVTNAAGEITNINATPGGAWSYGYDNLGRLELVESPPGQAAGTRDYDANGNLTNQDGQIYNVNPTNNQLIGSSQVNYQYDAMGNRISGGGTFSYGPNQRLIGVFSGFTTAQYRHNGRGERVYKKTTAIGPGVSIETTTLFIYDENGRLLGEYDEQGNVRKEYYWLDSLPVGVNDQGNLHSIITDHLGTPHQVVNAAGTTVWQWESLQQPFGNSAPDQNPDGDNQQFVLNLRFPGQYFDWETGLHYNYFRDYDPSTGRYLQSDPIGLEGGLNTYSYVSNKPLTGIDSLGLSDDFNPGFAGDPIVNFLCFRLGILCSSAPEPSPGGDDANLGLDDLSFTARNCTCGISSSFFMFDIETLDPNSFFAGNMNFGTGDFDELMLPEAGLGFECCCEVDECGINFSNEISIGAGIAGSSINTTNNKRCFSLGSSRGSPFNIVK